MTNALYRLGLGAARHPWRTIGAWLAIAVTVITLASVFGRELEDTFEVPGLDSQIALDLLNEAQSEQAGLTAKVVVTPSSPEGASLVESLALAEQVALVQDGLQQLPKVIGTTPTAELLQGDPALAVETGLLSEDGAVALIQVQYPVLEELRHADLDALKEFRDTTVQTTDLRVEMGGPLFFNFEEPGGSQELIGLVAAVIILVLAFGSVVAMGLPIATALFGLAIGMSSMSLITYLIDIPLWTPDLATMIGLGVGIDYALFLVTRHREYLAQGYGVPEAAGRAVATAGQAVIFAGGTVVIAILGLSVAGIPFITAAAVAISVVVGLMVLASVTLVPGLLGLVGPWINRLAVRWPTRARAGVRGGVRGGIGAGEGVGVGTSAAIPAPSAQHPTVDTDGRWDRWGRHVSRHAWPYAIVTTVFLLAVSAPALDLQLGFPDDGTLPETHTERRAFDLATASFGPGTNGPLFVVVAVNGDTEVIDPLAAAVTQDPGIDRTAPPAFSADGEIATIVAIPSTSPQADATTETVERIRNDIIPTVLTGSDASAHVGGPTANFADIAHQVAERLPWFILAVLVLSFCLLTILFRSILVPLKAALLNLLSIGAAYGVIVMVFQWGWGKDLIGLETTIPVVSFVPMFMFALLFGLSMDYEVFLLSRIREAYAKSGDNTGSVIYGIASTARVITSAALIMVAVFLGFVLGDDPTVKLFGLGLATAILVDVTIVRVVLVPATMKLMGDANWWLPGWLDRILPSIDFEGTAAIDHQR